MYSSASMMPSLTSQAVVERASESMPARASTICRARSASIPGSAARTGAGAVLTLMREGATGGPVRRPDPPPPPGGVQRDSTLGLPLAPRAVVGAPLTNHHAADPPSAAMAGLPLPRVDAPFVLVPTVAAIGSDEVADARAAGLDGS